MSLTNNLPEKWGYKGSLAACIGKTISDAEIVRMEFGSVWDTAWVVEFRDGTKAFFSGREGAGMKNPDQEAVKKSRIFTAKECGEMEEYLAEKAKSNQRIARERERAEYEKLKEKFEGKG